MMSVLVQEFQDRAEAIYQLRKLLDAIGAVIFQFITQ